MSWTTVRESEHGGDGGGHFFIADYGIKVCAAKDTVVVWEPTGWHGTSLAHCDPEAEGSGFYQAGLAIVTPPSLTDLWRRIQKGELSAEQAEQVLVAGKAF